MLLLTLINTLALGIGTAAQIPSASDVVYPITQSSVSSPFGFRLHPTQKVLKHHDGIDLAAPVGTQVRSAADGEVIFAGTFGTYGKLIVIQHERGFTTHYGHLSKINVSLGQIVTAGSVIGLVGCSGEVTGAHLHFEVRYEGIPVDPEKAIGSFTRKSSG